MLLMARGMGCTGIRVTLADEIEPAFRQAMEADGPVVIDFITSPEASFRDCVAPPLGSLSVADEE